MKDRLNKIIWEQSGLDIGWRGFTKGADSLKTETNLRNDLSYDSLDEVELIMACEVEFDCEITDKDVEKIKTVGDCYMLIEKLTR